MYQLFLGKLRRLSDSVIIPPDAGNADYQEYLVWRAASESNQPLPEPLPTRAQFEAAAKIRAATALKPNLDALASMLSVPGRAAADYAALAAFQTAVRNIPLTTNLAAANDEAGAFAVMVVAYDAASKAPALTAALKAEFAEFIRFEKALRGVVS